MKQKITVADYAQRITESLPQGVLLNTNGDKHNAMVIGWGGLGTCWSVPTFTVYVRENRYTKSQLDKTGVFTVSIPLDKADPVITKICGWQSGHNIDKVKEAGLTLEDPQANGVSGVKEYPLTLECRVIYKQKQDLNALSPEILNRFYPENEKGLRDCHIAYYGEIVDAYVIV